jgi:hypothetical protein
VLLSAVCTFCGSCVETATFPDILLLQAENSKLSRKLSGRAGQSGGSEVLRDARGHHSEDDEDDGGGGEREACRSPDASCSLKVCALSHRLWLSSSLYIRYCGYIWHGL